MKRGPNLFSLTILYLFLSACTSTNLEQYPSAEEDFYYSELYSGFKGFERKKYKKVSRERIPEQYVKSFTYDNITVRPDTTSDNSLPDNKPLDLFSPYFSISETKNGVEYEIVTGSAYDNLYYQGYWLNINNGDNRGAYYLGLTENWFYHFKDTQTISLFKNDSVLQIQFALVAKIGSGIVYSGARPEQYELIEDNLIAEIKLKDILLDSDKDGLTDIAEKKMWLDPLSSDTDNDGITDKYDSNARFKSKSSERSKLYSLIFEVPRKDSVILEEYTPCSNLADSSIRRVELIIHSDSSFQHFCPPKNSEIRYIVLSKEEFAVYKKQYPISLDRLSVSPLFKVDDIENCYKAHMSGSTYILYKKEQAWTVDWNGIIILN